MTEINRTLVTILSEISKSQDRKNLAVIKTTALGKNSFLARIMDSLKDKSPEERRAIGQEANFAKQKIIDSLNERESILAESEIKIRMESEYIDVTMPPRERKLGKLNPLTVSFKRASDILEELGFSFAEGPEIETDFYNFTALNMPEHHPARTMHDTFYISHVGSENLLLRTHTSPVQIRAMSDNKKPPFRIFSIGRTYRSDSDATHTPMFNQIEGMVVGEDINFANLKWVMMEFFKRFFAVGELNIRFRPSFFPFTEPSAEMDMACCKVNDKIVFGKGDDWLEMCGCGMIHPTVLKNCNIEPTKYQGFAFGIGLERITSLKYGIPDIRQFFSYDERFEDSFYFNHYAM